MEHDRAKERERLQRLAQPNKPPAEATQTKPKPKKRKRPRKKRPARPDGRETIYYSSSDEEQPGGAKRGEERKEASGGFDAGLASYKKLLSALEGSAARVSGSGSEDEDLAAAVVSRRMQREGRDGYGSESQSEDEEGIEEEGEEDDEGSVIVDSEGEDETAGGANRSLKGPESASNGSHDLNDAPGQAAEEVTRGDRGDTDADTDEDEDDLARDDGNPAAGGRSRDEFCRHFVSTAVFPEKEASAMLSPSGRPSFKPLPGAPLSKWAAAGLSASASRNAEVPPALPSGASLSEDLGVLPSLAAGWEACNGGASSRLQSLLLPSLTGYRDMLYCGWRDENAGDIRRSYALHALNHALTSQRRVTRHTSRLRKAAEEARVAEALARGKHVADAGGVGASSSGKQKRGSKAAIPPVSAQPTEQGLGVGGDAPAAGNTIETESDEWQRDQGFTRPKVLILLPFRGVAHELVEIMIGLLGPKTVVINKDRFDEEYGPDGEEDDMSAAVEGAANGDARLARAKAVLERKPEDWKALLGGGRNVDDMFTLGLSLSPGGGKGKPGEGKGVGVRLYCDFYNSDIIIASPVALHRACVPDRDGGGEGDGGVDADFLSSVEVCIMDRADVFLMQNWAYVPDIAEVLNARPKGERAARADFSRVRPLFLHEQGRLFRQTLVFSAFQVRVLCCVGVRVRVVGVRLDVVCFTFRGKPCRAMCYWHGVLLCEYYR